MISSNYTADLCVRDATSRIVLLVIDGLGGLPHPDTGRSELETASLPNLDALAARSSCGVLSPLGPGFTPGSGPAHLALFGYDPWTSHIGRGALSALGLGLDFAPADVAARLNFCTIDAAGLVTDRRAGRIPTQECERLCAMLGQVHIDGVQIRVAPEMEYRAAVVFRGDGLSAGVTDSDPQVTGHATRPLCASAAADARMVEVAEEFLRQAGDLLANESPANMVLIRGFGAYPSLDTMQQAYGLNPVGIAGYPMYRGVARAVGMETPETAYDLASETQLLARRWKEMPADFYYVHVKKTDSAGEDGDFDLKVKLLEEADSYLPAITDLEPDVLIVTGDHSTPSIMGSHSWHPVPVAIASKNALPMGPATFDERCCSAGSLGHIPSSSLMALALAHAGRLSKFGA
jgi:2,3-bisphosphoglycerate-independent phosphoglycerate mutase